MNPTLSADRHKDEQCELKIFRFCESSVDHKLKVKSYIGATTIEKV